MFYAPPFQRDDRGMYALSTPAVAEFYAKNGLTLPTEAKVVDAATKNAQALSLMSNLTLSASGIAAVVALSGLPPTLLTWALANPADAVTIGVISTETAAVVQSGAISPSPLVGGIPNARIPGRVIGAGGAAEDLVIQFGRVENQISHTFRHIEAAGFQRDVVSRAIQADLNKVGAGIRDGQYTGSVIVDGVRLDYSAFRLPNGTINVGRITPPKVQK